MLRKIGLKHKEHKEHRERTGRDWTVLPPFFLRALCVLCVLCVELLCFNVCRAGSITATVKNEEPIQHVFAILRDYTKTGVYSTPMPGHLDGNKIVIDGLPAPGRFDLEFDTDSGRVIGWDAHVPASDYEQEQPLSQESRKIVMEKMSTDNVVGFPDQAVVLDVQGNIQNAAVLMTTLRNRTFIESAGANNSTWIWRVDRWQWHFPNETTWTPVQDHPYYALARERLKPEAYQAKCVLFARHLGGIYLTKDRPDFDAGIILVPKPQPGIHAINPDGSAIEPIVIKPRAKTPSTQKE